MQPTPTATDYALRSLVEAIAPSVLPESAAGEAIKIARQKCRAGNPFPLIAMQWPELLITEKADAGYFDGQIGDPENPCLRLDWWQRMILAGHFDATIKEIYIKGCTGAGKGGSAGIGANLYYDVYPESRGHCTGPNFSHTASGIFGEIKEWRKKMRFPAIGNNNTSSIVENERHYITILNPERGKEGETFSGKHGKFTYYYFDEGTACESTWFENAAKNAAKIICLANPRTVIGHFRNAFKPLGDKENQNGVCYGVIGRRLCVTVSGLHCANVRHNRLKDPVAPIDGITVNGTHYAEGTSIPAEVHETIKPVIPGQIDLSQYRSIVKKSAEAWKVRCFAHGMFPDEDPQTQIFLASWLHRHSAAHIASGCPVNAFGLDVARSLTGDDSCLAAGSSVGCRELERFKMATYPEIADHVLHLCADRYGIDLTMGENPICIDYGGGYGAGVGDWLAKAGVWVIGNVPASRAFVAPELYQNARTEMHALLGRRLSPEDQWGDTVWMLPNDELLHEEMLLTVREWSPDFTKFRIIPKEVIKENLPGGRSPDRADSVALLFEAVRDMAGMNEHFAATSGELAVWPRKEATTPQPPVGASSPQKALGDLLGWMQARRR